MPNITAMLIAGGVIILIIAVVAIASQWASIRSERRARHVRGDISEVDYRLPKE